MKAQEQKTPTYGQAITHFIHEFRKLPNTYYPTKAKEFIPIASGMAIPMINNILEALFDLNIVSMKTINRTRSYKFDTSSPYTQLIPNVLKHMESKKMIKSIKRKVYNYQPSNNQIVSKEPKKYELDQRIYFMEGSRINSGTIIGMQYVKTEESKYILYSAEYINSSNEPSVLKVQANKLCPTIKLLLEKLEQEFKNK